MIPLPHPRMAVLTLLLATLSITNSAFGQGFFLDRRDHAPISATFDIREVSVDTRIRDQVAEVQVSQTFHNPGSLQTEAEYLFPVPEGGAIQNFVLLVDGQELPGKILPKEEARRIYEEIVRRRKDPALLEYMGRGLIRTRVFPIPPGADRKVTMRYTSMLPRDKNVVDFLYPLGTQKFTRKPIEKLSLRISIESKEPLKSIYSPSHDVSIERDGNHHASLSLTEHNCIPQKDFHLVYTLSEDAVGATVLSYRPSHGEDGYFLLLASPEIRDKARNPHRQPKTVIFVIDRSGSMSGKKIEQARDALKFVLENLYDDDTFNVVAYDDRVESFKPELQRYNRDSRKDALRFVENLYPGGSTNIDAALGTALEMIKDRDRPSYVLFLTDGLPTAGETSETAIAAHARESNHEHARIFSFGVGYDVNARLLDRLSGTNSGTTVYVKPDENIEAHVARFYARLTSPVLSSISITFDGTDVNRTYPRDVPDLFEGGQLLWVGRYRDSGRTRVQIKGKVGSDHQRIRLETDLAHPGKGHRNAFIETLWASRRVGDLIDQIDLHGPNSELTNELVDLSRKYGILTPYTSFLAEEPTMLHAQAANVLRAQTELGQQLSDVTGVSGVNQRQYKKMYQDANLALPTLSRSGVDVRAESLATLRAAKPVGVGGLAGQSASAGAVALNDHPSSARRNRNESFARSATPQPAQTAPAIVLNAPAANAQPVAAQDAQGKVRVVEAVRRVGQKTFFRKNNRWVDSSVTPELEARAITIEQFSDPYFDLARSQSAEMNQYLTFEEPVTVNLNGQVYKINRPATP